MPVVGEAASMKVDTAELPPVIPILALRNAVVFPGTVFPVTVGREKSVKLVQDVEAGSGWLAAIPQVDVSVEDPQEVDLFRFGTVCKLIKTLEMPDHQDAGNAGRYRNGHPSRRHAGPTAGGSHL